MHSWCIIILRNVSQTNEPLRSLSLSWKPINSGTAPTASSGLNISGPTSLFFKIWSNNYSCVNIYCCFVNLGILLLHPLDISVCKLSAKHLFCLSCCPENTLRLKIGSLLYYNTACCKFVCVYSYPIWENNHNSCNYNFTDILGGNFFLTDWAAQNVYILLAWLGLQLSCWRHRDTYRKKMDYIKGYRQTTEYLQGMYNKETTYMYMAG